MWSIITALLTSFENNRVSCISMDWVLNRMTQKLFILIGLLPFGVTSMLAAIWCCFCHSHLAQQESHLSVFGRHSCINMGKAVPSQTEMLNTSFSLQKSLKANVTKKCAHSTKACKPYVPIKLTLQWVMPRLWIEQLLQNTNWWTFGR